MFIVKKSDTHVYISGNSTYKLRGMFKRLGDWDASKKRWCFTKRQFVRLLKGGLQDISEKDMGRCLYYMYVKKNGFVVPSTSCRGKFYCVVKDKYCSCDGFHFRKRCKHV